MSDAYQKLRMKMLNINEKQISEMQQKLELNFESLDDRDEKQGYTDAAAAVGMIMGFAIYISLFFYGTMIMKGVMEEKTNRIVEVIISSLKPFELMMGKIIGIALVGLTQFVIWVVLVTLLGGGSSGLIMSQMELPAEAQQAMSQAGQTPSMSDAGSFLSAILGFNFTYIISVFVFYFITGYLFYGALFAAIGSAVDSETDTQQFMLPVTMPLVLAIVLAQSAVMSNPNGTLAFWLSVIPLTSPIVMMMRIPFGVPGWELALSMVFMIIGFVFAVWIASRIYRIGILMYGKKPSYKEIGKWLFSKG
jgi:ABC-2 type transport system permease protein